MAKFKFDLGFVIYYETVVEADNLESAKSMLDEACEPCVNGSGDKGCVHDYEGVEMSNAQKHTEFYGIRRNSTVQVTEQVLE
jgi:hypothetical protein